MDSKSPLTGPELEELYLRDNTNDHLKEPENIWTLLNYVLRKDIRDLTHSDLEILKFCKARIHPQGFPDERKLQFMHGRFDLIEKEKEKKEEKHRFYWSVQKIAACFAFLVIGAVLALGLSSQEAEAGIFDWVKNIFIEESGEQLVISTPNAALNEIEIKEGHLPDRLPDEYRFQRKRTDLNSFFSLYQYYFFTEDQSELLIEIKECTDQVSLYQNELEINKASSKSEKIGDITYYYSTNLKENRIAWIKDMCIYNISASCSFSELEEIISYYE